MPVNNVHSENRKAFLASKGCGSLLLEAYSLLVVIELALKDYIYEHKSPKTWADKHNIGELICKLNGILPKNVVSLSTHWEQLAGKLGQIQCTDMYGQPKGIKSYPELRYLRFDCDFGTQHKECKHLKNIIGIANDIIKELKLNKVNI